VHTPTVPRVLRFGAFEADLQARELRKQGMQIKLQEQPFQILAFLLEHAGEIVTREQIRQRLWPTDTFVDVDNSVNAAVNRLREALGDSAESPRFVETLPRRGYRFVASVTEIKSSASGVPSVSTGAAPQARPDEVLAGSISKTGRSWGKLSIALGLAVTIIVASVWAWEKWRAPGTPRITSLAVLPLENLSRDPDQEYFADGMTEALTTELAQISSLKVISHTSVVQYKGTKKSLPQIAQELSVDAVVEGAVQRSGDKVEITVQLIQAPSDRHLWAKSYERDLRDVLALQREVAHAITDEIKVKLTPSEKVHLASARSIDSEAYEDYLKGRFLSSTLGESDARKSIAYFQRAMQENPNYALAYAGLAESYITLSQPWNNALSPKETLPQAKATATKALAIDDSLGEAHSALAHVIELYDWDWQGAEKEYRRALELIPNDAMAHLWYGEYLQVMGRNEEGFVQLRQAIALDPLNVLHMDELGGLFFTARQYDEANRAFQKAFEMDPNDSWSHLGFGEIYGEKKMYREAIAELEKAVNLSDRTDDAAVASLGKVLGDSGRKQEARNLLEELKERSEHHYISPYLIALVQIGLGERDEAIASLEQGYTNRDQWMMYLKVDPRMDDLRSDPRFKDLLRRVGLEP
jgi:TolB-like protein/DNA-binding winged helix-turn-helix (wHTH) protein/Tfp pilus assembly protein PilF